MQGVGETFGRVTVEAMAFGVPVRKLCLISLFILGDKLKHIVLIYENRC